jgi:hypothetical protein
VAGPAGKLSQLVEQPCQDLGIAPAEELLCLRPRHGDRSEPGVIGVCERSLEFICHRHHQALATALRGQRVTGTRARHDLFILPAGQQRFQRSQLNHRVDALGSNGVERRPGRSGANGQSSTWLNDINPGNTVVGKIAFDMPAGAKAVKMELHDSMFSGGVIVHVN